MNYIHAAMLSQKPDLSCIVKTWLSEDINDRDLLLDHNRHGGGIMICVSSSLSCKVLLRGAPFNYFLIFVLLYQINNPAYFSLTASVSVLGWGSEGWHCGWWVEKR